MHHFSFFHKIHLRKYDLGLSRARELTEEEMAMMSEAGAFEAPVTT